jgi:sigma-B regulation protein RsbU (phosphoserine phosphatase)
VAARERLEREIEVAQNIQASFLPDACPEFPGWDICAFWRSARQVGGDFYDFIPLRSHDGGERWGIVVADVSDKGVPAALYMALSRTLLRSVAIGRISPAATLARVNDLILADARSEQFVTVFYGVWEPASGCFTYASAGHNPPVWARHDDRLQPLGGQGMALGVMDGVEYREHEIHLQPGDVLVLYTDGLPDAINALEEEFGMARLEAVVQQTRRQSASEIQSALTRAVQAHVGPTEAFDDMTLVVLKRNEA